MSKDNHELWTSIHEEFIALCDKHAEKFITKEFCFMMTSFVAKLVLDVAPTIEEAKLLLNESINTSMAWKKAENSMGHGRNDGSSK